MLKHYGVLAKVESTRKGSTGTRNLRAMAPQVGGDEPGRESKQISFLCFYMKTICALLKTKCLKGNQEQEKLVALLENTKVGILGPQSSSNGKARWKDEWHFPPFTGSFL